MTEKRRHPIQAVGFDIDGTLYSNWDMYRVTLPLVARHVRLFSAFGRARKTVREEYPIEDLEQRTVELTAGHLGWEEERTRQAIGKVIYHDWEARLAGVSVYPGVRELLHYLRGRGIKTAAMSDFPALSKIRVLGLDGLWDAAFSSEQTQYLKPRREPFDRLARELGVPASRILYVGNSYAYDVIGANGAGMQTAHRTRRVPPHSLADFSFSRFSRLHEWLETRLALNAVD